MSGVPKATLDPDWPVVEVKAIADRYDELATTALEAARDVLGGQPDLVASLKGHPVVGSTPDLEGLQVTGTFEVGTRYVADRDIAPERADLAPHKYVTDEADLDPVLCGQFGVAPGSGSVWQICGRPEGHPVHA